MIQIDVAHVRSFEAPAANVALGSVDPLPKPPANVCSLRKRDPVSGIAGVDVLADIGGRDPWTSQWRESGRKPVRLGGQESRPLRTIPPLGHGRR